VDHRPPRLTNGPRTGRFRVAHGQNVPGGYTISSAGLAQAMLDALDDDTSVRATLGIAYWASGPVRSATRVRWATPAPRWSCWGAVPAAVPAVAGPWPPAARAARTERRARAASVRWTEVRPASPG
jgi:hypothetical protein